MEQALGYAIFRFLAELFGDPHKKSITSDLLQLLNVREYSPSIGQRRPARLCSNIQKTRLANVIQVVIQSLSLFPVKAQHPFARLKQSCKVVAQTGKGRKLYAFDFAW